MEDHTKGIGFAQSVYLPGICKYYILRWDTVHATAGR